jgi:hypothetical protein
MLLFATVVVAQVVVVVVETYIVVVEVEEMVNPILEEVGGPAVTVQLAELAAVEL